MIFERLLSVGVALVPSGLAWSNADGDGTNRRTGDDGETTCSVRETEIEIKSVNFVLFMAQTELTSEAHFLRLTYHQT